MTEALSEHCNLAMSMPLMMIFVPCTQPQSAEATVALERHRAVYPTHRDDHFRIGPAAKHLIAMSVDL